MTPPLNSESKKVCLMGASAVGKTSLVRRFVYNRYDETYRTTIGGRMYEKSITCDEKQVNLVIRDLEGKDDPRSEYSDHYLKGAQGYMLVVDVTRPDTLDVAKGFLLTIMRHHKNEREQKEKAGAPPGALGKDDPPFVLLLNKQDILQSSEVANRATEIFGDNAKIFETSAKTGERVNEAFNYLARQTL
jgi:GTPase SAR1 family protein